MGSSDEDRGADTFDTALSLAEGVVESPKVEVKTLGEHGELRLEIKDIASRIEESFVTLGEMFYRVWKEKIYLSWGFDSFDSYVSNDLNNWGDRKAKYLVAIHRYFKDVLKDEALLEELKLMGWTKLKDILYVVDRANKDQFIKLSDTYGTREFARAVKVVKEKLGDTKDLTTGNFDVEGGELKDIIEGAKTKVDKEPYMAFYFTKEQHDNVKKAIEIAGKISRAEAPSNNLSLICLDFMANNSDFIMSKDNEALCVYLERLEAGLGVKLVCIKEGTIIHGASLVEG